MPAAGDFINALRGRLSAQADPARAAAMQAYMKSSMRFLGVPTPARRRLTAECVEVAALTDTATLVVTMLQLWRKAVFREERYAAIELARVGAHARLVDLALLPVYQEMIAGGAWWDYCDDISGNGVRALLERDGAALKPTLLRWAHGDDLWLRRAAMLCQRRLKSGFDAELLYATILPSIGKGKFAAEFFIRKGIGWALRERSYRAPDEVLAFCREYESQLAPLTLREALKLMRRRSQA
jgi:3-methyladenine DNA glycosylase AlkD